MNKRYVANTGVGLSLLGLGTVKFGRNQSVKYPGSFDLPSDEAISHLLAIAHAAGITTLDTAPAYGLAEERLGRQLKLQNHRQQWQIITKAGEIYDSRLDQSRFDFTPAGLRLSLETSLRRLQTDYIDCWLLHSDGNDTERLNDDVIACLQKAKQEGWVRSIGMSTKTVDGGALALQHLDCIMMTASLSNTGEMGLFDVAEQLGKSILLKKIYDSGWALTAANKHEVMCDTLSQLFRHKAVCSAIVGTINPAHLQENIHALEQAMGRDQ